MPRSPQIQPVTIGDHVCIFHLTPGNQETSIKRKNSNNDDHRLHCIRCKRAIISIFR